jgi:hypothetical protein
MNLYLRFPTGSAGYGVVVNPSLEPRLLAARNEDLIVIHRTGDTFEVLWIDSSNWKSKTRLAKKHFPEARLLQIVG